MAVPSIDVLLAVGEVPSLEYLTIVAQVLEGGVGVDLGEAAVKDGDTDTLAIDASLAEQLALHTEKLVGKGGILF